MAGVIFIFRVEAFVIKVVEIVAFDNCALAGVGIRVSGFVTPNSVAASIGSGAPRETTT